MSNGLALGLLLGAVTFLAAPQQAQAAMASHGSGAAVAVSVLDQGIVEPVHYSKRYGWHCGMYERYGHGHKEACWRGGYWGGGGWGRGRHHWDDRDGKGRRDGDRNRDRDGGGGDRGDKKRGDRNGDRD